MAKEYVPIFFDWLDTTQDLSAEEKGNLIDAVVAYASGKEYEHLLTGGCKIAFRFLKGQVDRNNAISDARSKAGSNKNDQDGTKDNKKEQNETNSNKSEQNESNSPKEKDKEKEKENKKREQENEMLQLFDRFYSEYPRHEDKQSALRAFKKINPDVELLDTMLSAIEKQKASPQWKDSQYIPLPSTWLNKHRWEDEVRTDVPVRVVTAQSYTQRDYDGEQEDAMRRMLEGVRA